MLRSPPLSCGARSSPAEGTHTLERGPLTLHSHGWPPTEGCILLPFRPVKSTSKRSLNNVSAGVIAGMGVGVDGNDEVMGLPLPAQKCYCAISICVWVAAAHKK